MIKALERENICCAASVVFMSPALLLNITLLLRRHWTWQNITGVSSYKICKCMPAPQIIAKLWLCDICQMNEVHHKYKYKYRYSGCLICARRVMCVTNTDTDTVICARCVMYVTHRLKRWIKKWVPHASFRKMNARNRVYFSPTWPCLWHWDKWEWLHLNNTEEWPTLYIWTTE